MRRCLFAVLLVAGCSRPTPAEVPADLGSRTAGSDWAKFLGPTADGKSPETGIYTKWPKDGLKILWETEMGLGFAPPVVSRGRLFHFDRFRDQNRLSCRNAETGKLLWKFEYETDYQDLYGYSPGPRTCPVADDDRVYVIGPEGMLHCVAVADGKEIWKVDTRGAYHVHQNFFGVGSAPWVEGDVLIVAVGGSPKGPRPTDLREAKGNGSGVVGFDKKTGKELYKVSDETSSYASPVVATVGGERKAFYFARTGLLAFDPKTGANPVQFPWRAKVMESVNASNPVVVGDKVLVTECYGPGSAFLEVTPKAFKKIWTDDDRERGDKALRCHWNTPVHEKGFVYGSSGRHENEAELRCVELATGEMKWKEPGLTRSSLTAIDGHFLCMTERGELLLLKVNPAKFEQVAKWQTDLDSPCWAAPVVSHGLMYIRGKDRLLCAELMPDTRPKAPDTIPKMPDAPQKSAEPKPTIISNPIKIGHLVATRKISLADGLLMSISFVIVDPSDPEFRKINSGMIALAFVENLTEVKDYRLSGRTQAKLSRGGKDFSLTEPKFRDLGNSVKTVDYASFTAGEFLLFLKGSGKLSLSIDGKKYELNDTWNEHVSELLKEVESQKGKVKK